MTLRNVNTMPIVPARKSPNDPQYEGFSEKKLFVDSNIIYPKIIAVNKRIRISMLLMCAILTLYITKTPEIQP